MWPVVFTRNQLELPDKNANAVRLPKLLFQMKSFVLLVAALVATVASVSSFELSLSCALLSFLVEWRTAIGLCFDSAKCAGGAAKNSIWIGADAQLGHGSHVRRSSGAAGKWTHFQWNLRQKRFALLQNGSVQTRQPTIQGSCTSGWSHVASHQDAQRKVFHWIKI